MKVAVFTGCQPRHVTLVERLASIADTVYASMEVNTLFPGEAADFFTKSEVMQRYFAKVIAAERAEFGAPRFLPDNVRALPMKSRDLSKLDLTCLRSATDVDVAVVFGASYIRSPLVDILVERETLNLHMGTSPYFRGSSCNFWAAYDNNPDYIGATIHLLTAGLDSGPMLCHALPNIEEDEELDYFALGMRAVHVGIDTLVSLIHSGHWRQLERYPQDKTAELRYTRNKDFNDSVAEEFLIRAPAPAVIRQSLKDRDGSKFILPPAGVETPGDHSDDDEGLQEGS